LKALERESKARAETQVFIETPYRSAPMFDAILAACASSTRVAVAIDLTGPAEFVRMRTAQQWKAAEKPPLQRQPAVFCLLAA
jgi:16S rRNA (cytidine1402-2'-O)-methyltransferase